MYSIWHLICHYLTKTSQNFVKIFKNQPLKNREISSKTYSHRYIFHQNLLNYVNPPLFPFYTIWGTINFGPTQLFEILAPPQRKVWVRATEFQNTNRRLSSRSEKPVKMNDLYGISLIYIAKKLVF